MENPPPDIWRPIRLTIELSAISTFGSIRIAITISDIDLTKTECMLVQGVGTVAGTAPVPDDYTTILSTGWHIEVNVPMMGMTLSP